MEDQPRLQSFLTERLGVEFELAKANVSPLVPLELSKDVEARFRRKFAEEFTLYDSIEG